MPVQVTPSMLFKTAALLNAITVPGHVFFGFDTVHPVLKTINTSQKKNLAAKTSAQACFNYVNGGLLIAALLNWQWAKGLGPRTFEEKSIFWVYIINHVIDGLQYFGAGEYGPLGCMWIAPACSAAGYLLS